MHTLGQAWLIRAQAHLNHEPELSLMAQVGPSLELWLICISKNTNILLGPNLV